MSSPPDDGQCYCAAYSEAECACGNYGRPPDGATDTCTHCDEPIAYNHVDFWIHADGREDPVPCEAWVPIAEPAANNTWKPPTKRETR